MGTSLLDKGVFRNHQEYTRLWSAAPLFDASRHHHVIQVHRDHIQAGASFITANTYACTSSILEPAGYPTHQQQHNAIQTAVKLAHLARAQEDAHNHSVRIIGSLPPLYTSYVSSCVPQDTRKMVLEYKRMVRAMVENNENNDNKELYGVDVLLCETMSCVREAIAAVQAAVHVAPSLPIWVAFTVNESGDLRSGETLEEAQLALHPYHQVTTLCINCSTPEECTIALQKRGDPSTHHPVLCTTRWKWGVYPNGFVPLDDTDTTEHAWNRTSDKADTSNHDNDLCELCKSKAPLSNSNTEAHPIIPRTHTLNPSRFLSWVDEWVGAGVSIVGGCCGIGTEHIQCVANAYPRRPLHHPLRRNTTTTINTAINTNTPNVTLTPINARRYVSTDSVNVR